MWKQLWDYSRKLVVFAGRLDKVEREQAEMRREIKDIQTVLERILISEDKDREIWEKDKRILFLELQHQLDQLEKRLPAPRN